MADFESLGSIDNGANESLGQPPLIYRVEGSDQLSMLRYGNAQVVAEEVSLDLKPPVE
jgi:hypothetical protein